MGFRSFIALAVLALPAATLAAQEGPEPEPAIRGITISTHGGGRDWGTDRIGEACAAVKEVGATWVATHPYARIERDGTVRFRGSRDSHPPVHWVRPIQEARKHRLKILIKPHLAFWGSGWSWRGEISFDKEEEWRRFFDTYERWILELAGACKSADGFVVGTELDRTVGHEKEWRRIIAGVRKRTKAGLTYAANWTDYDKVGFWDALDAVGVQAYFPVAEHADAGEKEIRAGWKRRMGELHAFAGKTGRKIVFTELGYNRSHAAPLRPWDPATDGPEAQEVQGRCLGLALQAVRDEPSVIGCFLWKWFPPPRPVGRDFQLATPALKRVIKGVWTP